jgi:hypothetical protein
LRPIIQVIPDSTPSERYALDYFRHRSALELGGVCLPELWSKYILSTTHSNDAIRHAIVALVTFHQDHNNVEPSNSSSRTDYALKQYSRGVKGLLQLKVEARPDSYAVDVTLMCCIIFAAIEILRGNFPSALIHFNSGKSILSEEALKQGSKVSLHLPRRLLGEAFQRIESQLLGFGDSWIVDSPTTARPAKPVVPEVFKGVEDAFFTIETLHNQILHFFSYVGNFLAEQEDKPEAFDFLSYELKEFENLFARWEAAFDRLLRRKENSPELSDYLTSPAILLLQILRTSIKTLFPLRSDEHMLQVDFDRYNTDFANIVAWAEQYLNATSTRKPAKLIPGPAYTPGRDGLLLGELPSPLEARVIAPRPGTPFNVPYFTMSSGVVSSLYLCGTRCRDPVVRRKASDLLQYGIRREGIWHSLLCSKIVDVVMRTEEDNALRMKDMASAGSNSEHASDNMITSSSQIPEMARVTVNGFKFVGERTGWVGIRVNAPSDETNGAFKNVTMGDHVYW